VTPGTHFISGSNSYNGSDEQQEQYVYEGLGGVSNKFVWQNTCSFPTSQETFCDVYGPQYVSAEQDVMSAFENIFDTPPVPLIADETNRYAKQKISRSVNLFTFCYRIRKVLWWTNYTWLWLYLC
jgi:hypothetical protein